MTTHHEIIANLKQKDQAEAERWEEEIDIIIHKLKFLTSDAIPTVGLIDQSNDFQIATSSQIQEKVKIAGGKLAENFSEHIEIFIILQSDESLYSLIPSFIDAHNTTKAITNNKIYIIQSDSFNINEESYLQDLEVLAEIIQPKYFVFGRDGQDWIKFDLG